MSEGMVARVGRAIAEANEESFDEMPDFHLALARAAIAAMRNPTGRMFDAGTHAYHRNDRHMGAAFNAMIDAALSESMKGE